MKRKRHHLKNEDKKKDMLSNLPDCVLLHIMSFMNARKAVCTCVLSTRWKYLWKHLPTLTLSPRHFRTVERLFNFVPHILSLRYASTLNSLDFQRLGPVDPRLLERMLTYAFSHNISHLRLCCYIEHIPPSLFSCSSLTSLDLRLSYNGGPILFPDSLNFPSLTNLKLRRVSFDVGNNGRIEPFSNFKRLNTLLIDHCLPIHQDQLFCISSTTLLNLAIDETCYRGKTPFKIKLSTPNLCAFSFTGASFYLVEFHESSLSSIKQVSIETMISEYVDRKRPTYLSLCGTRLSGLLYWFVQMPNIQSLTLCPRILQTLSSAPDLLNIKFTYLCNMKSLKLNLDVDSYQLPVMSYKNGKSRETGIAVDSSPLPMMSWRGIRLELAGGKSCNKDGNFMKLDPICLSTLDRMIEFFLQNSPSAKFVIVLPNPSKRH